MSGCFQIVNKSLKLTVRPLHWERATLLEMSRPPHRNGIDLQSTSHKDVILYIQFMRINIVIVIVIVTNNYMHE